MRSLASQRVFELLRTRQIVLHLRIRSFFLIVHSLSSLELIGAPHLIMRCIQPQSTTVPRSSASSASAAVPLPVGAAVTFPAAAAAVAATAAAAAAPDALAAAVVASAPRAWRRRSLVRRVGFFASSAACVVRQSAGLCVITCRGGRSYGGGCAHTVGEFYK